MPPGGEESSPFAHVDSGYSCSGQYDVADGGHGGRFVDVAGPVVAGGGGLDGVEVAVGVAGVEVTGCEQPPRVIVGRVGEDVLGGAAFDEVAVAHDQDSLAHPGHQRQVVGDEQQAGAAPRDEFENQFDDLALHGDVEGGGWFVADQQVGIVGEGYRDEDALALPAGELVRVGAVDAFGVGDADVGEQLESPVACCGVGVDGAVVGHHLCDLRTDGHQRVQGGHGFLEHHGYPPAAECAHPAVRVVDEVPGFPVECHLTMRGELVG